MATELHAAEKERNHGVPGMAVNHDRQVHLIVLPELQIIHRVPNEEEVRRLKIPDRPYKEHSAPAAPALLRKQDE